MPHWIPHANRCTKISCEVLIFLLSGTAICVALITFFEAFFSSYDPKAPEIHSKLMLGIAIFVFASYMIYLFILEPIVNVLNHSVHRSGQGNLWHHRNVAQFWHLATYDLIEIIHRCTRQGLLNFSNSYDTIDHIDVK